MSRSRRPSSKSALQKPRGARAGPKDPEPKLGATKNTVNIVGQQLVLFHASQSPTLYDPSFMKTFRLRRGGVDVVRMYREDSARSDILAVDWSEDIRVTSSICARKVTGN